MQTNWLQLNFFELKNYKKNLPPKLQRQWIQEWKWRWKVQESRTQATMEHSLEQSPSKVKIQRHIQRRQ